jgi:hypothetical protein
LVFGGGAMSVGMVVMRLDIIEVEKKGAERDQLAYIEDFISVKKVALRRTCCESGPKYPSQKKC